MDSRIRKLYRGASIGDLEAQAQLLIERKRSGELAIPNNLLRVLTSVGYEPVVRLVGGPPRPSPDHLVYRNPRTWSPKPTRLGEEPKWWKWREGWGLALPHRIIKSEKIWKYLANEFNFVSTNSSTLVQYQLIKRFFKDPKKYCDLVGRLLFKEFVL